MNHLLSTLNLNCRRAARLLSDRSERPLSGAERFGLSAHLLVCRSCRRYRTQIDRITDLLRTDGGSERTLPGGGLSAAARLRITRALETGNAGHDDGPNG